LAAVQDDPSAESHLRALALTLAQAQRNLFEASRLFAALPESVAYMRQAMEYLARALQLLQDLRTGSPAVSVAAKSVAKSLSTLYAATQSAPKTPSRPPPPPPPELLTDRPSRPTAPGSGKRTPGAAPPPTMDDRRRKTVQVQLDQVLDLQGDTNFYTGLSGSIEEGGIFIATFDHQPINSKIAVTFTLPSGETVITRGMVRWIREFNPDNPDVVPGMGVRFVELTTRDRGAIERYLQQRAPLLYDED
jgi:uncharacterized protein (TIGR02266 family)